MTTPPPPGPRKFTVQDIKDIRLLLFGKHGRGMFEIRTSPAGDIEKHGEEYTADSKLWKHDGCEDCNFPVDSNELTRKNQIFWPNCYEGIVLDLYVRQPNSAVGMNSQRDDWLFTANENVTMENGKWKIQLGAEIASDA